MRLPRNLKRKMTVYIIFMIMIESTHHKKIIDLDKTHPAYSPDILPSDHHLLRSLQSHINGKPFHDWKALKLWLSEFFNSRELKFYKNDIIWLPQLLPNVIDSIYVFNIDSYMYFMNRLVKRLKKYLNIDRLLCSNLIVLLCFSRENARAPWFGGFIPKLFISTFIISLIYINLIFFIRIKK